MIQKLQIISSAYGHGAGNTGCSEGPVVLRRYLEQHPELKLYTDWYPIISDGIAYTPLKTIAMLNNKIGEHSCRLAKQNLLPINIGGDHSCAIGMWSGIAAAYRNKGDIGLIWIDAHLDAHTFETTPTGNIHGMPVAALLGYGDIEITSITDSKPKLKPKNIVFIGARSFEDGEHKLLQKLGVTIYYMEDVKREGFETIFNKAVKQVSQDTIGYGISFDLDGIDPEDAPGVGIRVPDGLKSQDLINTWKNAEFNGLIGLEIVEYNPNLDKNNKTLDVLVKTIQIITSKTLRNKNV